MKVIVTTSLGMDGHLVQKAKRLAEDLGIVYCERRKQAVKVLLKQADAVLVVYKDRLVFEQKEGENSFSTQILPCCGLSLEEIRF